MHCTLMPKCLQSRRSQFIHIFCKLAQSNPFSMALFDRVQLWPITQDCMRRYCSGVARAFRVGHGPKWGRMRKVLRKIKKIDWNSRKKWGKWNSCPPGTARLATALYPTLKLNKLQKLLKTFCIVVVLLLNKMKQFVSRPFRHQTQVNCPIESLHDAVHT